MEGVSATEVVVLVPLLLVPLLLSGQHTLAILHVLIKLVWHKTTLNPIIVGKFMRRKKTFISLIYTFLLLGASILRCSSFPPAAGNPEAQCHPTKTEQTGL